MAAPLILAIDQGTSATKCVLVDADGRIVARGSAAVEETHPQPGWVEQDPGAIWTSVREAVRRCLDGQEPSRVEAVGLSTQRESVVLWDRASGEALAPVLSWQDQRSAALCDAVRRETSDAWVRARSGLPLDPMFSAAKMRWLLDAHDPARTRDVCLGTIDSWLLSRFGAEHVTEIGNASRTQLMHVAEAAWDDELLALFAVPRRVLPRIVASDGPYPAVRGLPPLPDGVRLRAVMGDSHAALFAHGARAPGQTKATYGTGSSVMGLLARPGDLDPGLCLTIAWQLGAVQFAAEGNIRASGSTLRWLASLFGRTPEQIAELGAASSARGVVLVPGFTGLGAPWWDRDAVGLLAQLRLDTSLADIARAALEAIVHQVADVVEAMQRSTGTVGELFADGGASRNDALMQMQADSLGGPVSRAQDADLSALGVAHMAGLGAGLWTARTLQALPRKRDRFEVALGADERRAARAHWRRAVERARTRQAA